MGPFIERVWYNIDAFEESRRVLLPRFSSLLSSFFLHRWCVCVCVCE